MSNSPTNSAKAWYGSVELHKTSYRAHLQRKGFNGKKEDVRGPKRNQKSLAETDLEELLQTRDDCALKACANKLLMQSENQRKLAIFGERAANYQACVTMHIEDGAPIDEWLSSENQTLLEEIDEAEVWQDIDEHGQLRRDTNKCNDSGFELPEPQNAFEASALLSGFRPVRHSVQQLTMLLNAKADPNIQLEDDISPLRKVLAFAPADRVGDMRAALLAAGATETLEMKQRWISRSHYDLHENAWLRSFHNDRALL